jgi:NAD(P)-dependent dehydrogenase (short-subunit alcohol dehydrogenase family)
MKTAIITGASVGIGAAAAARFRDAGFSVYNLSRRRCPVEGVTSIACDLSDTAAIGTALEQLTAALEQSEQVALIHNACQMLKDSALECPDEHLQSALQTNVIAANTINRALLSLLPAGSSVLYIGSTLSEKAVPNSFSYVISKHAVLGMMRATCQDLMGRGIHTACICPGFTDTEMLRTHLGNDQAVIDSIAALNSFNRLIEPDEIAGLIEWAHHNPVINGAVLHAHLGQRES